MAMEASFKMLSLLMVVLGVLGVLGVHGGRRIMRDQHDALRLARCDAKCWNLQKPEKGECISGCLTSQEKAGWCARAGELSAWDAACVRACERDSGCPGVLKCCQHDCGATCQVPRGLHDVQGLPSVPQNVTVWERRRGRAIRVRWSCATVYDSLPLLFVVEERHHVGRHFSESRLGEWTPRQRSQRANISLKNVVKPGRWYQFRVASINENGTKGFSRPSAPFTASHGPRPPSKPQDLSVDALRYSNGSLCGTLRWKAPSSSDLPIHKYKVYWSRRLQGVDSDLNSVLVHHHTVGKDQTMFEVKDLLPRSRYFLQVQALAQFGKTRLRSEKSAIVLNTTEYFNDSVIPSESSSSKRSADLRIEGLHLQKLFWSKDQLLASIAWRPAHLRPGKALRYSVQWWTRQCDGDDKTYKIRNHIAATTDVPKFKLYDLNFGCKYLVRVNRIGENNNMYASEISFKSPSCEQLQIKAKSEKIKCT